MTRFIFPSFHYKRDVTRAAIVRNSWRTQGVKASGFRDAARFEQVKRSGETAVKMWIEQQLQGASVTVVLIGQETATRPWVKYEIERSVALGMGLVGVRIHAVKSLLSLQIPDSAGPNPLDLVQGRGSWGLEPLSRIYRTYDYVADHGYQNLGSWVEEAARIAKR